MRFNKVYNFFTNPFGISIVILLAGLLAFSPDIINKILPNDSGLKSFIFVVFLLFFIGILAIFPLIFLYLKQRKINKKDIEEKAATPPEPLRLLSEEEQKSFITKYGSVHTYFRRYIYFILYLLVSFGGLIFINHTWNAFLFSFLGISIATGVSIWRYSLWRKKGYFRCKITDFIDSRDSIKGAIC